LASPKNKNVLIIFQFKRISEIIFGIKHIT